MQISFGKAGGLSFVLSLESEQNALDPNSPGFDCLEIEH